MLQVVHSNNKINDGFLFYNIVANSVITLTIGHREAP